MTDTKKIAEIFRSLPVSDPNLGEGHWIGEKFFGIKQELSFPYGIGLVEDGVLQPVIAAPAVRED